MQNGDEASPSIILVGRALLVKILITLEPHGIFGSIVYTIIFLTGNHQDFSLKQYWYFTSPKEEIYPFSQNYFQIC